MVLAVLRDVFLHRDIEAKGKLIIPVHNKLPLGESLHTSQEINDMQTCDAARHHLLSGFLSLCTKTKGFFRRFR